jgi:DNA polymerase III delta prime subunit
MVEDGTRARMMSGEQRISAYTPSNMDPKVLKRIFVQRETFLERVVDRLATSMTTGDKDHILLVGPRGSGKTCMVSLAAWELQKKKELNDVMRIAWLGEDDTFSGLIHFAFGIAKALADEYPDEFPADFKSDVRGLPQDDAALSVFNGVVKNLKHRQLLVITENLDQTFSGLGDTGQKKLRAFLQETRRFATLATSQQLFAAVSSRKEAFFGFFDTQHLQPLEVEDATQLISNIAKEQNKLELVQFLNSTDAKYRIRALHHLAGGNHRMYVLLAEFLTQDTLDDLVSAFEELAEQMTPYFQERLRSLPDQQRQLVQCLCDAEGAMTVKEVAEETFIAEGNCSKQLGNLKAKGYVRSQKRGKESYYDMAEPLMRLCLEIKNQRGRPLRLVARFLRAWFPVEKLQQSASKLLGTSRAAVYCQAALLTDNSFERVINTNLVKEIREKIDAGSFDDAIALADELSVSDPLKALFYRAEAAWYSGDLVLAVTHYASIIETPDAPADLKAKALVARGFFSWGDEEWQASLNDFEEALSIPEVTSESRTISLFALSVPMVALRSQQDVLAALTTAFEDGDRESQEFGGTPNDLLAMILKKGPSEWADYVAAITPLYVQHRVAEKLGQGITQSIQYLDEGGFSDSQRGIWNDAWQIAGKDCDDLQIPLECLDAAVDVMKSDPPTDRPLFRLPLEIRQLVRPLLNNTLGPAEDG